MLYAAWLADDGTHGAIRVRAHRNSAWQPASAVDANVFRDQGYSIDQGPNLLVTPDGKLHIVYIGTWELVPGSPTGTEYGRLHHKYSGDGGATWTANDPPTRYTHSPALATDPQGNLYVFGHREYWKANRCANMLVNIQPAGGAWGAWKILASGCYDSSVSAKWCSTFGIRRAYSTSSIGRRKGRRGNPTRTSFPTLRYVAGLIRSTPYPLGGHNTKT